MSETRPAYQSGEDTSYRVKLSYHLTVGQTVKTKTEELVIEQTTAIEAARLMLVYLERHTPPGAVVTNIQMVVSLEI